VPSAVPSAVPGGTGLGTVTAMSSTRLLLVRHGESQVTVRRVVGGERTCTGLSPLGVRQAEALRDRFRREGPTHIDVLISSTLPRAYETAAIVGSVLDVEEAHRDPDLVEHRPGDADGIAFADFAHRFDSFDLRLHPERPLAPGGESLNEFRDRVIAAITRIEAAHRGATVVVVCHGGVIDIVFREFLGVGLAAPFDLWTLNTSITEFVHGADRWTLRRYNDAAHLAGLPEKTVG
jgi:probable phosphoglycerate mutase